MKSGERKELAAIAPGLAPAGSVTGAFDVNGNPVFKPSSGVTPTLNVSRTGEYKALYAQDTWQPTRKLTVNYGVRMDWFNQSQNLGQAPVSASLLGPRVNFSYQADGKTTWRASYNKLFNVPPIAQGAIVGAPIQPETLSQYDLGVDRKVGRNQTASAAYYYKDIKRLPKGTKVEYTAWYNNSPEMAKVRVTGGARFERTISPARVPPAGRFTPEKIWARGWGWPSRVTPVTSAGMLASSRRVK